MHVGLCLRLVTTFGSVADIDSHEGGRGGLVVAAASILIRGGVCLYRPASPIFRVDPVRLI